MRPERVDIAVIGAGPAGIAAAASAAERGRSVVLIDDNPASGGQIWRGVRKGSAGKWLHRLAASGARVMHGMTVVGKRPTGELLAAPVAGTGETVRVHAAEVILATGARELFLPFPGWTLPGVCGVGSLQSMVKAGYDVRGKRVLIAGTGPLLLAVAQGLADKGASVLAIVEQAEKAAVHAFALGLWRSPGKLLQAAWLKASLFAVPYWTGAWPVRAEPESLSDPTLKAVALFDGTQELRVECDVLACGFGLLPNTHLAAVLGCAIEQGAVKVDGNLRAGPGLFAAGEATGIGGVDVSLLEGEIAGLIAAGAEGDADRLRGKLKRARAFAAELNTTFALRNELKKLVRHETVVCRCEDVTWGRIRACTSWRDAKLQTRCGMGPCQGRVCGPAIGYLTGWTAGDARLPAGVVAARAFAELLGDEPVFPPPPVVAEPERVEPAASPEDHAAPAVEAGPAVESQERAAAVEAPAEHQDVVAGPVGEPAAGETAHETTAESSGAATHQEAAEQEAAEKDKL